MTLCRRKGCYQGYSDRDHNPRWYEGRCTLPKGHIVRLADHEVHGIRLAAPDTTTEAQQPPEVREPER